MGRHSNYDQTDTRTPGHCEKCDGKLRIIDSRKSQLYTRRRIECEGCGDRFTTAEIPMAEYQDLQDTRQFRDTILDHLAKRKLI